MEWHEIPLQSNGMWYSPYRSISLDNPRSIHINSSMFTSMRVTSLGYLTMRLLPTTLLVSSWIKYLADTSTLFAKTQKAFAGTPCLNVLMSSPATMGLSFLCEHQPPLMPFMPSHMLLRLNSLTHGKTAPLKVILDLTEHERHTPHTLFLTWKP